MAWAHSPFPLMPTGRPPDQAWARCVTLVDASQQSSHRLERDTGPGCPYHAALDETHFLCR